MLSASRWRNAVRLTIDHGGAPFGRPATGPDEMTHVRELDANAEDMFHQILGTRSDVPLSYKLVNLYWRYMSRYSRCCGATALSFDVLVTISVLAEALNVDGEPEVKDEDFGKFMGWADVDRYTRVRFQRSMGERSRAWVEGRYIKQEDSESRTLQVTGFNVKGLEKTYVVHHECVRIDRRNGGG